MEKGWPCRAPAGLRKPSSPLSWVPRSTVEAGAPPAVPARVRVATEPDRASAPVALPVNSGAKGCALSELLLTVSAKIWGFPPGCRVCDTPEPPPVK